MRKDMNSEICSLAIAPVPEVRFEGHCQASHQPACLDFLHFRNQSCLASLYFFVYQGRNHSQFLVVGLQNNQVGSLSFYSSFLSRAYLLIPFRSSIIFNIPLLQVKVISLDFKDSMRQLTLHAMPNRPHSLALVMVPLSFLCILSSPASTYIFILLHKFGE